jgi:hypothetical protein
VAHKVSRGYRVIRVLMVRMAKRVIKVMMALLAPVVMV